MIYTVTFNPAIDYIMNVKNLEQGMVNRSESEEIYFGGKGINVSIMLKTLGVDNVALGFCAGFTGDAIISGIEKMGIKTNFVKLESGVSRINIKIKSQSETDLNGQGPNINENELKLLYSKLDNLRANDTLVLAGSIPKTLPENVYQNILEKLKDRKIRFVVDATNDLLVNVLKYKPFLIKPNNFELGEIFGKTLNSDEQVIECAKKLREQGAQNVLVSLGKAGAILCDENGGVHKIGVPEGKAVNSVGAGDSMVAGFLAGYMEKADYEYALKLGTAAGSATAFSMGLGEKDKIDSIMKSL